MSDTTTTTPIDDHLRSTRDGETPSAEYLQWAKAEIEKRMADKAAGNANYTDLEQVRAEFGL